MKYFALSALPLACAFGVVAASLAVDERSALYLGVVVSVKAMAALGSAAAALRFLRGDYLRLAWWLQATCYGLLLFKDVALGLGVRGVAFPTEVAAVRGLITLLANAAGVIAVLLLARAWQVAGILLPGSPRQQRMVFSVGVMVSLAIAGHAAALDLEHLFSGEAQALVAVASDLGDILSTALVAPVALTALALRGGLLAWPWTLMTASLVSWLLYDASGTMSSLGLVRPQRVQQVEEVFRAAACLYTFASGIAQRWVMDDLRARSTERAAERRPVARHGDGR